MKTGHAAGMSRAAARIVMEVTTAQGVAEKCLRSGIAQFVQGVIRSGKEGTTRKTQLDKIMTTESNDLTGKKPAKILNPRPYTEPSPCIFGDVSGCGAACYCDHVNGPRKCPVWRKYGLKAEKWTKDECPLIERRKV